jgi:hypothetical protein
MFLSVVYKQGVGSFWSGVGAKLIYLNTLATVKCLNEFGQHVQREGKGIQSCVKRVIRPSSARRKIILSSGGVQGGKSS